MENEDESAAYLQFFNDGENNFLLSGEENFVTESLLSETDPSWSQGGFSILLSTPLTGKNTEEAAQVVQQEVALDEDANYYAVLSGSQEENLLTSSNNVILSNDILLQLAAGEIRDNSNVQPDDVTPQGVNGNSYSVSIPNDVGGKTVAEDVQNDSLELTKLTKTQAGPSIILNEIDGTIYSNHTRGNVQKDQNIENVKINVDLATQTQQKTQEQRSVNIITEVIDGIPYTITFSQSPYMEQDQEELPDTEKNEDTGQMDVIKLLNLDGTITTIDKNKLAEDDSLPDPELYSEIQAKKCSLCPYICETVDEIKQHLEAKHNSHLRTNENGSLDAVKEQPDARSVLKTSAEQKVTVFLCSECGRCYANKNALKSHMIMEHNLVISIKDIPEKPHDNQKASAPSKVKRSPAQQTSENLLKKQQKAMKMKCAIKGCTAKFADHDLKLRHENCHVNQERSQFMCPQCKQKFSLWRLCSMHMWKCHKVDTGLMTCPMCSEFKSLSLSRVLTHMSVHTSEKPYLCTSCGAGFKQLSQLKNHEAMHNQKNLPNWYAPKICESCDRTFTTAKSLKTHIKFVHDKFKPFSCHICGHQTARKAMLQLHLRQHTGVKPFQCQYCPYRSRDHNCLRKHSMKHIGFPQYQCPHCEYRSIQTSSFKTHLRSKHPGKEGAYICETCNYTTINIVSFQAHVKCHEHDEKSKGKNDNSEERNETVETDGQGAGINNKTVVAAEDEETQNCFLNTEHSEEAVDTGGITIPAGFDLQLVSSQ